jgi:hypothetical protein
MKSFFVGNKAKPTFLVEINPVKKEICVYTPDIHSKNEEFFEKYSLGKIVLQTKYTDVLFLKKPVVYKNNMYVSEIIVKMKNKYVMICTTLSVLPSI